MDERVTIFIDGSNLYYGLKNLIGKVSIDFYKFSCCLADNRKLIRTYYYNAPVNKQRDELKYQAQQRFFEKLKNTPTWRLSWAALSTGTAFT